MITLKILQQIIILPVLSRLIAHNHWAPVIGLVMRSAKPATTNPFGMSSDQRNGAARAMIARDLDVSRAYIMLNRFNR